MSARAILAAEHSGVQASDQQGKAGYVNATTRSKGTARGPLSRVTRLFVVVCDSFTSSMCEESILLLGWG